MTDTTTPRTPSPYETAKTYSDYIDQLRAELTRERERREAAEKALRDANRDWALDKGGRYAHWIAEHAAAIDAARTKL